MADWADSYALLRQIADQFGTPCFVYDFDQVKQRIADLREAFGGRFQISYAVKSNPNRELLKRLHGQADMIDVSSGGELQAAIETGWPAELISFTGPAKRDVELKLAAQKRIGHVVLESVAEAERLDAFASSHGTTQPVLVRISPTNIPHGFGVGMAGRPTQFGIDEEEISPSIEKIQRCQNLRLEGFHIYCGTQCLKSDVIAQCYKLFIDLFRKVCLQHQISPKKLIFGSGLGIPYHDSDRPLVLSEIAAATNPLIDELRRDSHFANTQLAIETGRYLVGEAGLYLTRVVSTKQSRGTNICIMDGGMNHHLGAAGHLGSVIHRNYRMFKVGQPTKDLSTQPWDLYGPLCTSIDLLGRAVQLAPMQAGDLIAIHCSGAYGLTASPINFISHPLPSQVMLETIAGKQSITRTE